MPMPDDPSSTGAKRPPAPVEPAPPPIDTPWWRHCSMRAKVSGLVLFAGTAGVLLGLVAALSPRPTVVSLASVALLGAAMVVIGQAWLVTPVDRLLRWVEGQGDAASPTDLDRLPIDRDDEVGRISQAMHAIAANAIRQRIQSGVLARRFDDRLRSATKDAIARFRDEAMRDELTGLGNRKAFNEFGKDVFARACAAGDDVICIAIDLDRFKLVNDTLGHAAGDKTLAMVGELIRDDTRATDVSVRLGGDEFAVLLQGATLERATTIAEETRRRFRRRAAELLGEHAPAVDLSIGLASRRLDRAHGLASLLERADERLYAAKRLGRGRTVVSDDASASGDWPAVDADASLPAPATEDG
ncbi:MAG: GGDEF domain-containing protein [Planctomycetota bacterium]